jgi:hypothetical protein
VSDVGSGSAAASGGSQLPKKFPEQASRKALYSHPNACTLDETETDCHDLILALRNPPYSRRKLEPRAHY